MIARADEHGKRPSCRWLVLLLLVPGVCAGMNAGATVFYVDPVNGSPAGDGSHDRPWQTLQQVLEAGLVEGRQCQQLPYQPGCTMEPTNPGAPVKAGDTLRLLDGYHGEITVMDAYLTQPLTVEAEPGHGPRIKSLRCLGAGNWIFRGLSISPSHADPYQRVGTLVMIEDHDFRGPCQSVTVEDCRIFSVEDSSSWSAADWNDLACSGIQVQGPDCVVRGNHLLNVDFGISVSGPRALVSGNTIENFAGDGLRGLGDHDVFENNLVKNCYDVNQNHDDGFQSWSTGANGVGSGEVVGVVLRGNTIINYTDPSQPHRGTLQGIGCFDGFYTDWVVENNVIITDHWHGITFLGARNLRMVNNTVVDINQVEPGPAWIRVGPHKDGTPSSGWVVRNNLVMSLQLDDTGTADHNLVIDFAWAGRYFVDYAGHDLHLAADSPAINTGAAELAPDIDHDGVVRPQGGAVDIGAYEWVEDTPPDGGDDGGQATDAGADANSDAEQVADTGPDAGTSDSAADSERADSGSPESSGCSCGTAASRTPGGMLLLLLAIWLLGSTRRRLQHPET